MAQKGLRYELNGVFDKALKQKEAVTLRNISGKTDGEMQTVDVTVQAIWEPIIL